MLEVKRNYGVAGEAWVRWLTVNQKTAEEIVRKVHIHLKKVINFNDDERYWHTGCTTLISSAIMLSSGRHKGLNKPYAGILDVAIEPLLDALKTLIDKARGVIKNNVRTAEDVLNA